MAPLGLPSALYSATGVSMAALAAGVREKQQQPMAYTAAESSLKQRFLQGTMVAAAPAEGKKIEMYSKVWGRLHPPRRPPGDRPPRGPHPPPAPPQPAGEGGVEPRPPPPPPGAQDFYMACTIGGILACGLTHTAVTPLDVVKCNMQIDPKAYGSIGQGFSKISSSQGVAGLFRGWVPTALGYSAQGACKFGFYEFFKK